MSSIFFLPKTRNQAFPLTSDLEDQKGMRFEAELKATPSDTKLRNPGAHSLPKCDKSLTNCLAISE